MASKDWQGQPVPADEPPDAVIPVWQVSPHTQRPDDFDSMLVRGWQDMIAVVGGDLDSWLERFSEDELREGVTLKFRLVDMRKEEYENAVEE